MVDGAATLPTAEPWVRLGVDHRFPIAGHDGIVHIRMGHASLSVDGRSPDTGLPLTVAPPMSFALLIAAIVVVVVPVSLASGLGLGVAAVPVSLIGSVGGGVVLAIATRTSWTQRRRLTLGAATGIAAVVLTLVAAIGMLRLTAPSSERPFTEWSRVEMSAGGFSLVYPASPTGSATTTSSGTVTLQVRTLVFEDGSAVFGAAFTDYPSAPANVGAALEGAVQNIVASNGGSLVEDQSVTAEGLAGREVTVSVPRSGSTAAYVIHARVFFLARRFYQITAILKGSGTGAADNVVPFFGSFALDPP